MLPITPPILSPILSMTGFARINSVTPGGTPFVLTLKSVNHRFLDLQFNLPGGMDALEMQWRKLLKEHLKRGHVDVRLSFNRTSAGSTGRADASVIRAYLDAFRAAAVEHGIEATPDLNIAFRLPGAWTNENGWTEDERVAAEVAAASAMPELLESLNAMRAQEGGALGVELGRIMIRLSSVVDEIDRHRTGIQQAYLERIEQRMQELLVGVVDRERILQEAAMVAERSDVEEEIARMRGHIAHFQDLLRQGGELGKKLDFLLQEMSREANTTLSKTGGIASKTLRITELGLAMKAEIEKAREQVQNIE